MAPPSNPPAEPVRIRDTRPEDLDFVLAAETAQENSRFVASWSRERHLAAIEAPGEAHWIVEHGPEGRPAGYAILLALDGPDRCVEFKRMVVTEKRRGLGRALLRRAKAFAFGEKGAHRLWLDVLVSNAPARRLYASEGFVEEGVLRECTRCGDRYDSLILLGMLEEEYRALEGRRIREGGSTPGPFRRGG